MSVPYVPAATRATSKTVAMVTLKGRYAALRLLPTGVQLRTAPTTPWIDLDVVSVRRTLPWRVRLESGDGSRMTVTVLRQGEVDQKRLGERSSSTSTDASLGDDPISGVIAVVMLVFYLLALPYIAVVLAGRSGAARRLCDDLTSGTAQRSVDIAPSV